MAVPSRNSEVPPRRRLANFGLYDQLAALKWIQVNIEAFGGDPSNVALFGPDSASALPLALLTSRVNDEKSGNEHQQNSIDLHTVTIATSSTSKRKQQESNNSAARLDKSAKVARAKSSLTSKYHDVNRERRKSNVNSTSSQNNSANNEQRETTIELFAKPQAIFEPEPKLQRKTNINKLKIAETQNQFLKFDFDSRNNQHLLELFSKVWLVNPTIFYEFTFEHAIEHSKRLLKDKLSSVNCNNTTSIADCLRNESAESILRSYLGADDASYRLDDETSMPIHGIFADQLIVVDETLINSFFPFEASSSNATTNTRRSNSKHLLIGSSAQAVEFWPCPLKAVDWTFDEFWHYISTSLNSFSLDAFQQVCSTYNLTKSLNDVNSSRDLAVEKYFTIVSDIRQVCPVNQLATNLRLHASTSSVQRYISETRPSRAFQLIKNSSRIIQTEINNASLASKSSTDTQRAVFGTRKHAFHLFDLIAFFGFESLGHISTLSDPDFVFQSNIRQMVSEFVHNSTYLNPSDKIKVFTNTMQRSIRQDDDYKRLECNTLTKAISNAHAWVS